MFFKAMGKVSEALLTPNFMYNHTTNYNNYVLMFAHISQSRVTHGNAKGYRA
jgi:hypothetical protein